VVLMAASAWLIFLIAREHTGWKPAAWIAAGLFLAMVDIHRFHGGFPRAFVHPVVLSTVLLSLRRQPLAASLVAAGGAVLYPPAALLAVGVLALSALGRRDRRPQLDRARAGFAGLALAVAALAVLGTQWAAGGSPRVFTAGEARLLPEFGPRGPLHFFADSAVGYLSQNRSGFDLRVSGSIVALAALLLLLVRPANLRLLRAEVLALPVAALAAYALAQAVLFKLYLPHRYTYPLVAFFAIVVGVTIRPTWTALWARRRPLPSAIALLCGPLLVLGLALYAFPLGPRRSIDDRAAAPTVALAGAAVLIATALALALRRAPATIGPAAGALLSGLTVLGVLVLGQDHAARGSACPTRPVTTFLASLPKDAVIAGDPSDLKCLPATARRAVVISTQLAPAYEVDYFFEGRKRMFAMLRAQYGPDAAAIPALRARYGATHLWVRRDAVRREMESGGVRWRERRLPYGAFVRRLLRGGEPAVLRLPESCRRWRRGPDEVYDIGCLGQ
jgi:hypothetical protein